jgi:hypothetical protein
MPVLPLIYTEQAPMMDYVCRSASMSAIDIFKFGGWEGVCALAIIATLLVIAILRIVASFTQNEKAIAETKMDLMQLFVTVAIIGVMAMLLQGTCYMDAGMLYPNDEYAGQSIYYSAMNHLYKFSFDSLRTMQVLYMTYILFDMVTTTEIASVPMGLGANMKPTFGMAGIWKPVYNAAFSALTISIISSRALGFILDFGSYALLAYFLPLGIMMRSFAPTRQIGGTVIAIVCTFLFIYPAIIIPTFMAVQDPIDSWFTGLNQNNTMHFLLGDWGIEALLDFVTRLGIIASPQTFTGIILLGMQPIAYIFVGGVFMPILDTLVMINIARYLSRALGEEIDITNLTRMI